MTNREKLNAMSTEELASFFCDRVEDIHEIANVDSCNICPVRKLCKKGNNGFRAWLEKEEDNI